VHIVSQTTERLAIPSLAVHHDMDGAYAYVVKKDKTGTDKVFKQALLKGSQYGKWIEIISGIKPGDQVVVKGFLGLRNNKEVQIVAPHVSNRDEKKSRSNESQPENLPAPDSQAAKPEPSAFEPAESDSIKQQQPEIELPQADLPVNTEVDKNTP